MNDKKTHLRRLELLLLLLIIPALACSTTIIKPAPAEINNNVFPTEPALPFPTIANVTTATTGPQICEVVADVLHLRDAPTIAGTVIAWLLKGDHVTILPDLAAGDWVKVQTADHLTGWINSIYCERKAS